MTGRTLAHYQMLEKLGAGGMGEVYRARDAKLGRDVAIKVLAPEFTRNAERLARFEREARLLAALNHPNIAAIHGFEHVDGVPFLVLEYVPGETLRGPLPVREALQVGRQITEALEAAHEKGIIHRDLKPGNIKITPEGTVKVLDFGLAKALDEEPAAADGSNSPTLSLAATRAGALLGTAGYMSPEQVKGKPADRRADIWAFGVVMVEVLSGKLVYSGETVPETLASVMRDQPGLDRLPAETPAPIRRLLGRCLEKDPRRRLRDIGEARIVLEDVLSGQAPIPEPRSSGRGRRLPWGVAAAAAAAIVAGLAVWLLKPPPAAPTTRFLVLPPDKATSAEYPAISPDGRRLAFVATVEGKSLLWVRPLETLAAQALAGTEEATFPFWSPDSKYLAFFSQNKLKKVDVSGGPPQTLCSAEGVGRGGAWSRDGTIVFGAGLRDPLRRVPAAGGVPAMMTTLDAATELSHRWPRFLPDGRHFLYWLYASEREKSAVVLASLDDQPDAKDRKRLLPGGSMAAFSAGHLLFEREGTLMAQPFDAARLERRGEPFPVVQQVGQAAGSQGWAAFSVSPGGTLAYRTGSGVKTQLAWFDRAGKELGRLGPPEEQANPRLSRDQKRIAVARYDPGQYDIFLLDLARETSTRFTFHPAAENYPVWSPDGGRMVFSSFRDGPSNLYQKLSSGAANEEPLLKSSAQKYPTDWSSDGRFILYSAVGPKTGLDLWVLPMEGDRKPIPVLQTEFAESQGQFSPDSRWIAYQSTESAPVQVYVQAFPKSGGKFQVSTTGGGQPRWRRDGKELYYLSPDRKMMAVEVRATATTFEPGRPRELFQTRAAVVGIAHSYDVTADGKRFLINSALEAEGPPPITVVMNWAGK